MQEGLDNDLREILTRAEELRMHSYEELVYHIIRLEELIAQGFFSKAKEELPW